MNHVESTRLIAAYEKARFELLQRREAGGHWTGKLSTSALSTATAVSALALVRRRLSSDEPETADRLGTLILAGIEWLADQQNEDGGWGDTDRSHSNIATTMLAVAAFHLTGVPAEHADLLTRADEYIKRQGGVPGLRRRYGRDKTFAAPILTNAALAGLVDWREVPALPFEMACFPQSWYRYLQMPVVSYAIPALVAIGQCRFAHRPPLNPVLRWIRSKCQPKSLEVLGRMQPESGGYLEAIPLTSFVVMSLASIGQVDHEVVRSGVRFLEETVRPDGSWPIDTNLATWNTTLSINALAGGGEDVTEFADLEWLLACQHRQIHPFTGAEPGGWGWSDLSGAVPDADDTPSALLALAVWRDRLPEHDPKRRRLTDAAALGLRWLLDLQNGDGGWPTFCRGWGKLPFDRSGADLTAHVLRALHTWRAAELVPSDELDGAIARGFGFLHRVQRPDGSWVPLWFGNQDHAEEENPVYGTARVLLAYRDLGLLKTSAARRGLDWLVQSQRPDGGWGAAPATTNAEAGSSVEETALALEALVGDWGVDSVDQAVRQGGRWLVEAVETGKFGECSPIGFYFAKLWYYEDLYPIIFTVAALGRLALAEPAAEVHLPATDSIPC